MDISDWRQKIDELDEQIVRLISQRAAAAKAIGELKRTADLPVYEPPRAGRLQPRSFRQSRPAGRCRDTARLRAHYRRDANAAAAGRIDFIFISYRFSYI